MTVSAKIVVVFFVSWQNNVYYITANALLVYDVSLKHLYFSWIKIKIIVIMSSFSNIYQNHLIVLILTYRWQHHLIFQNREKLKVFWGKFRLGEIYKLLVVLSDKSSSYPSVLYLRIHVHFVSSNHLFIVKFTFYSSIEP